MRKMREIVDSDRVLEADGNGERIREIVDSDRVLEADGNQERMMLLREEEVSWEWEQRRVYIPSEVLKRRLFRVGRHALLSCDITHIHWLGNLRASFTFSTGKFSAILFEYALRRH